VYCHLGTTPIAVNKYIISYHLINPKTDGFQGYKLYGVEVNATDIFVSVFIKELSGGARTHDFPALRMCVCVCVLIYLLSMLHHHVCVCMYVCTYVRTYVCTYVCTYVHT
jgi:hypothetical protein